AICWLQNARVLDDDCYLPTQLFPPDLLSEIIAIYHQNSNTKIFNHSITGVVSCRTQYMSAWASAIDELTWHNNILLIVAAGNLSMRGRVGTVRLSVQNHLYNSKSYPDYLLEKSCRIANPAQSFQALTVGSIAHTFYKTPDLESIAQPDHPSAFSRSGFGIWDSIKPEVVEYGGDYVIDNAQPPNVNYTKEVCPELVRSTLHGGFPIGKDTVGTSFSTPKVTHIAACLAAQFPDQSCLLYRALIVQSARWPQWTDNLNNEEKVNVLRCIGYGIPNLDRALGNSPHRITLMTQQERKIKAKEAHVYQVKLPQTLRSQGDEIEFLIEVTLSYKAQPRRTRRNRRRYLSTWLDWDCSKKGEDPDRFLARIIKDYESPEDAEKGEGIFKWTLGKQKTWGKLKGVSRTSGTIQKDWTIAKSFDLRESFCLAVVGHEGWNNDPDANVPYSLVVSFEAVNSEIPIYLEVAKAQIEIDNKIETEVRTSV
ncbi:MAG: S8 family peptidase, partial [Microcystaceae cyanobacterium]